MKTVTPEQAFAFGVRVFADRPPKGCDVAYLVGETADSEVSVLDEAQHLYLMGFAHKIAISALGEESGYPGFEGWAAKLSARNIGGNTLVSIPRTAADLSNTFTEAEELVRCAKREGWKSVICVAPAFYLARAFLGLVTVIRAEFPELKAYAHCGAPLSWNASVTHSQGKQYGTRAQFVTDEFEKVLKYDNLAHPSAVLEYLALRDA